MPREEHSRCDDASMEQEMKRDNQKRRERTGEEHTMLPFSSMGNFHRNMPKRLKQTSWDRDAINRRNQQHTGHVCNVQPLCYTLP